MAKRIYVIALEEPDDPPEWDWFETALHDVLDTWNNCGLSAVQNVDVLMPGDPEYDAEHTPGEEWDSTHTYERVSMAADAALSEVLQQIKENEEGE